MKILVFDTETTGLYNKKEKDLNKQPYIVQLAGIVVEMEEDGNYKEIERVDLFIKPPISIPNEVSQIHNIYNIDVMNAKTFLELSKEISELFSSVNIVVAHNLDFDRNMLITEFSRTQLSGKHYFYSPKREICTMKEGTDFCKLRKKNEKSKGYKRPKLQELCKKTLNQYFSGAHNALVDVEWTLKAFAVLVARGVINIKKEDELTLF